MNSLTEAIIAFVGVGILTACVVYGVLTIGRIHYGKYNKNKKHHSESMLKAIDSTAYSLKLCVAIYILPLIAFTILLAYDLTVVAMILMLAILLSIKPIASNFVSKKLEYKNNNLKHK